MRNMRKIRTCPRSTQRSRVWRISRFTRYSVLARVLKFADTNANRRERRKRRRRIAPLRLLWVCAKAVSELSLRGCQKYPGQKYKTPCPPFRAKRANFIFLPALFCHRFPLANVCMAPDVGRVFLRVPIVCFCSQKCALGGNIGRAAGRRSLSGELRQRGRFRVGLRVEKVKSYGLTPQTKLAIVAANATPLVVSALLTQRLVNRARLLGFMSKRWRSSARLATDVVRAACSAILALFTNTLMSHAKQLSFTGKHW